jgi:hypothetical protein
MTYKCNKCGIEHDSWPALTYLTPSNYHDLTDEEKQKIATLSDDFCTIEYENQTDRFIRCTLFQKVNDYCDNLDYGLWVSLSEKSYNDYYDNFKNENHEASYFGWLCNWIPDYSNTINIPMTVFTKKGNQRPEIIPHKDFDHSFVRDYYNGIDKLEAERRINEMIKNVG